MTILVSTRLAHVTQLLSSAYTAEMMEWQIRLAIFGLAICLLFLPIRLPRKK
jgi:hypothetical protein